jgi:hypothetical protein
VRGILTFLRNHAVGPAVLIVFVLLTLSTIRLVALEVPDWAIRGIAACETGTHWTDIGQLDRKTWPASSTGAVSPWHISLAVLDDLGVLGKAARIHRDPVLAESYVRQHLLHLYSVTGDWREAVAAWRAGLQDRHRPVAVEYSQRAFNYGTSY